MKPIISIISILLLLVGICKVDVLAEGPSQDMRAVWIATVYNIDFPKTKSNVPAQKAEFIKILDQLQDIGINTVVVQVRPKGDALYKSTINPWSDVLTGIQGKDPGYDPMTFMIEEAHKRGMEFHAWLNPYRVTTSGTDITLLSKNHPARLHPDWIISHNNALYYNPELLEVKNHITATVKEIITNYNVDGIHFDDYFYPSKYPLPEGEGKDGVVANTRRQHVNEMVAQVSTVIKTVEKDVKFGISPMGIWKNSTSDVTGSNTAGNESYYSIYADTRTWIKNEWIDYVVPQLYWETGNQPADYETLVKWWSNEVKDSKVKLYIGQGIYKDVVAGEIEKQLKINQAYAEVKGSFYYSMRDLLNSRAGCKEVIKVFNQSVPLASVKTGIVTASILNIRSGPGTTYTIITKVPKGTAVTILESQSGWHKVKLGNGTIGWASQTYVK